LNASSVQNNFNYQNPVFMEPLQGFIWVYHKKITIVRLTTGRSYGANIIVVLISTNSSLLRSLAFKSPVRDGLFVEKNRNQKNKPQRGDLFVNAFNINICAIYHGVVPLLYGWKRLDCYCFTVFKYSERISVHLNVK
jgi:hypothetical protein